MKTIRTLSVLLTLSILWACGPKLSQEKYVNIMTELGCKLTQENTPGAQETYKKFGATPQDIEEFRKKTKAETMMQVASQIALSVAACHGTSLQLD